MSHDKFSHGHGHHGHGHGNHGHGHHHDSHNLSDILMPKERHHNINTDTIKGVWRPRLTPLEVHSHHGHGHHHEHDEAFVVDWLDFPHNFKNNAFIIDLGQNGKAFNRYLNMDVRTGDVVFFGHKGLIRVLPRDFKDVLGALQAKNKVHTEDILNGAVNFDKLSAELQELVESTKTEESSTVELTGKGTTESPLSADVKISSTDNNIIEDNGGLYAKNSEIVFNSTSNIITYTDNKGSVFELDLEHLNTNNYITSQALNQYNQLVVKREGLADIFVDLEELEKTYVDNTITVETQGEGTARSHLKINVRVNQSQNNQIEVSQDGLFVNKDLSYFDNTQTDFAKKSDIKDSTIQIRGTEGLAGTVEFTQNQDGNTFGELKLSEQSKSDIQKGVTQESWGDHSQAGYSTENTTYTQGEGLELNGTEFKLHNGGITKAKLNTELKNSIDNQNSALQEVHRTDTQTIDFTGKGTETSPLIQDVKVRPTETGFVNALQVQGGMFVGNTKITFNNQNKILTFTDNIGDVSSLDLSSLAQDIFVDDIQLTGTLLQLKTNNGSNIQVDLSELQNLTALDGVQTKVESVTQNSFKINVQKSAQAGNSLQMRPDGLFVPEIPTVNDQKLTVKGVHALEGEGSFTQNQDEDKVILIDLSQETKDEIQKGVEAFNRPKHEDQGYVTTDTTYAQGEGLELQNDEFSLDVLTKQSLAKADTQVQPSDLGTIQSLNEIGSSQIVDKSVTKEKLSDLVQASLTKADTQVQPSDLGTIQSLNEIGSSQIVDKSVTKEKLSDLVQASLTKADTALQEISVSADVDNLISLKADGIFQSVSGISYDSSSHKLIFNDGLHSTPTEIDLSALTTDLVVTDQNIQGSYLNLVVQGGNTVTVDLEDLTKVNTKDSNTVAITGTGINSDKLEQSVKIDSGIKNAIEVRDGLFVSDDLQDFDNTITDFAQKSDIKDGSITFHGDVDIEISDDIVNGEGKFTQNYEGDKNLHFSLSQGVKDSLELADTQIQSVETLNTDALAFSGTGTSENPIKGNVLLSTDVENALLIKGDGLFQKAGLTRQEVKDIVKEVLQELEFIGDREIE